MSAVLDDVLPVYRHRERHAARRSRPRPIDGLRVFARPGFVLMTTSFELEPLGDGTRLSTETRVQPTDAAAARAFRPYWWAIRAGSGADPSRRAARHAPARRGRAPWRDQSSMCSSSQAMSASRTPASASSSTPWPGRAERIASDRTAPSSIPSALDDSRSSETSSRSCGR
jgi:hypothetical protein